MGERVVTMDGEENGERAARFAARDPWRMPFEIAGYRFLGLVGRGGMGTIYRAQQIGMDRPVAVKVLRPDLAENAVYVERLKREARVAGRLDHANIVKGIEVGEADGRHYFVMEYVEGKSLKTILKEQGTLDEEEVIELGLQIARGLQHAHREGVVHRDIKPSNILVSSTGVGKLADLGLARRAEDPTLTQDGATVGTPQYMAPEQATDSTRADPRSDLYSLGATLFHAATGRAPYQAESIGPLLTKLLHEPVPDPLTLQPDLSQGLALVLRKTLAKNPSERYSTATELIADLLRVRNHLPPRVPIGHDDDGRVGRFGFRLVVIAACVVLLAVALLVILTRDGEPDPGDAPERPPAVLAELIQLELDVAATPDDPRWLAAIQALGGRLGTLPESNPTVRSQAHARVNQLHGQVVAALAMRLDPVVATFLERVRERLAQDPFVTDEQAGFFTRLWPSLVEQEFPAPRPIGLEDLIDVRERELRQGLVAQREASRQQWVQSELRAAEALFEDPRLEAAVAYGKFDDADELLKTRRATLEAKFQLLPPEANMAANNALAPLIRSLRDRLKEIAMRRVSTVIDDMRRKKISLEESETADRAARFDRSFAFLEDFGLDSPEQLPGALRSVPETNPFVQRDQLHAQLEELDAVDRDRNSQHRWENVIRGYADRRASERNYQAALEFLDKEASEITEPAIREYVKDRHRAIERLQDLARDVARVFDRTFEQQQRLTLILRDGTAVSGVARAAFDPTTRSFPLGRTGDESLAYQKVDAACLLQLAGPELEARGEDLGELAMLLAFYDALGTPMTERVLEQTAALEAGPFKVMMHDWSRTAYEAYRSLSGDDMNAVQDAITDARARAGRGDYDGGLAALEELLAGPRMQAPGLRDRFGKDIADLLAIWRRARQQDEIKKEIEKAVPGARVELRPGISSEEDVYSVVLDLSKRSVLGSLRSNGARDLKGWDVDERGFHRLEEAEKMRDLAKGPAFDLRFGIYSFDFRHPVSMEMAVTCPEEEGVPFFFATIAGSWTFGFLTGGVNPDFQHTEFHLVEAAQVGRRGGRTFAMPGTSLDSMRGKLPARHEKGPQGRSVPFGGFLRGVTHRVRIDLLDAGKRVQVAVDGELLIDTPAQTRLRDRLELRAWDRTRFRELRVTGRLK